MVSVGIRWDNLIPDRGFCCRDCSFVGHWDIPFAVPGNYFEEHSLEHDTHCRGSVSEGFVDSGIGWVMSTADFDSWAL